MEAHMIREAIGHLVAGQSLSETDAASAMEEIMTGTATASQLGAFLTALRLKGETVEEVTGLARVMREQAIHVSLPAHLRAVDTCGTGGDATGPVKGSARAGLVGAGRRRRGAGRQRDAGRVRPHAGGAWSCRAPAR